MGNHCSNSTFAAGGTGGNGGNGNVTSGRAGTPGSWVISGENNNPCSGGTSSQVAYQVHWIFMVKEEDRVSLVQEGRLLLLD